jgi:hypothetical protein
MKQLCVSICCDIDTLGVVEHERSLRGIRGIAKCLSDFLSPTFSKVFMSQYNYRHKQPFYIAFIKYFEAMKISVLWYRHSRCRLSTKQSERYILDIL